MFVGGVEWFPFLKSSDSLSFDPIMALKEMENGKN